LKAEENLKRLFKQQEGQLRRLPQSGCCITQFRDYVLQTGEKRRSSRKFEEALTLE